MDPTLTRLIVLGAAVTGLGAAVTGLGAAVTGLGACGSVALPSTVRSGDNNAAYASIRALPGVVEESLYYESGFGHAGFRGNIRVRQSSLARSALDHALRILWQRAQPSSLYAITVTSPAGVIGPESLGLIYSDDFRSRYGPQSGAAK